MQVTATASGRRAAVNPAPRIDAAALKLHAAVVDAALDAVVTMDEAGRILSFNRAAERLFGYTSNKAVGSSVADLLVAPDLRSSHLAGLARVKSGGPPKILGTRQVLRAMRAGGEEFSVELAVTQIQTQPPLFTAFIRDLSALRAQELVVRDSERLLASAFDHAPTGMTVVDLEGRGLRVNDAFCRMLGYERHELLGKNIRDVTHPDDFGEDAEWMRRAIAGGSQSLERERRYVDRDGSTVWVHVRAELVRDDEGLPAYTVSLLQDLTEKRRVTAGLARSEARLGEAEHVVGVGSWEVDLEAGVVTYSEGLQQILGLAESGEIEVNSIRAMVHPDDVTAAGDAFARCLRTGAAASECRIIRPDRAIRTLTTAGRVVEANGDHARILRGSVLDVTDEREGFDAAPIGMLIAEPTLMRFVRVNDALCRMLGRTREQLLKLGVEDVTHPEDRAGLLGAREALVAGEKPHIQEEMRYLRADGHVVWAQVFAAAVRDPDGSIRAFSTQVIDMTERRERDHERQATRVDSLRRLASMAEYRDDATHQHTQRVARTAVLLGRALGMSEASLDRLLPAAALHDIGKIGIPDAILLKPGSLTDAERREMQSHTLIGADILAGSDYPVLQMAEEIALSHHERWDGQGYPHGVAGEAIPLPARIVAVADAFDACTHGRPYKPAWPVSQAVLDIGDENRGQFDPRVIAAFLTLNHVALMESVEPSPDTRPEARDVGSEALAPADSVG